MLESDSRFTSKIFSDQKRYISTLIPKVWLNKDLRFYKRTQLIAILFYIFYFQRYTEDNLIMVLREELRTLVNVNTIDIYHLDEQIVVGINKILKSSIEYEVDCGLYINKDFTIEVKGFNQYNGKTWVLYKDDLGKEGAWLLDTFNSFWRKKI